MNSKRLNILCNLIDKNDKVIDIGCDHAYLPIMLYKKNKQKVMAVDIHEKALLMAKKNIELYNLVDEIPLLLSDGLDKVTDTSYNALVIAGMGYETIKHILSSSKIKNIDTLYIQCNNDHAYLRKFMNKLGWVINKEVMLLENNQVYVIIKYILGKENLNNKEILFGKYNKDNFWFYLYNKKRYMELLQNIPLTYLEKRKKIENELQELESYIEKEC